MDRSALVVIDMQNDFVLPGAPACVAGALQTLPRIQEALSAFRGVGLPVFHVTRAYRADGSNAERTRKPDFDAGNGYVVEGTAGSDIVEGLEPRPSEYCLQKPRFSAFMDTPLDKILRRLNVNRLAISGTQYPNCIRATAFDALSLDYDTYVLTDACSAASEEIARANILDMQNVGITCKPVSELVGELTRET